MTRKSAKSRKSNDLSRCRHRFPGGRRCRLPLSNRSPFFCADHAHLQPPAGALVDLAPELTADVEEFTSASDINEFLSNLLILLSQDRISPRRGAVLAYTCNLLLRTLPAIEHEVNPKGDEKRRHVEVIWDLPCPDREKIPPPAQVTTGTRAPQSPPASAPAAGR
ncbi:MAG: hypothetical protein ACLP1Y_17050 [Candidatus Acidiferrales bacterium]